MNTLNTSHGIPTGTNPETQKVIDYMLWRRSARQIVAEYFGLRQEVIYDDSGEQVIGMVDEFKETKALREKKVRYTERLTEMGITEDMFNKLFINWLPEYEWTGITNTETGGDTEKANAGKSRKAKA